MEVHHHPDLHHRRKPWVEYSLEFIMIFLAVTMGFFAESYREKLNDRAKEKKYVQSITGDLKKDTLNMNLVIQANLVQFNGMDSLAELLVKNPLTDYEQAHLYSLNERYAISLSMVSVDDMTMRQMLSSGNMRLIDDQKVADRIMRYYGEGKDGYDGQATMYVENMQKIFFSSIDIFSFQYPKFTLNQDSTFSYDLNAENFKLLTQDKRILEKYSNQVLAARALDATYINVLHDMGNRARDLLSFLNEEYHLK